MQNQNENQDYSSHDEESYKPRKISMPSPINLPSLTKFRAKSNSVISNTSTKTMQAPESPLKSIVSPLILSNTSKNTIPESDELWKKAKTVREHITKNISSDPPTTGFVKTLDKIVDKSNTNLLFRTILCNSLDSDKPCKFGEKCQYAHSIEELSVKICRFGYDCKMVHKDEVGDWYNKSKNFTCKFIHPEETKKNFYFRITPVKNPIEVVQPEKLILQNNLICDETFLKVPIELALQAVEIAVKDGKTNIRVEII